VVKDTRIDPLLEAPMTGLVRRIAIGQVLPACAGAQNPEHTIQDLACWLPRATGAARRKLFLWNQRLKDCPLLIR
jgi:hypothetical protein